PLECEQRRTDPDPNVGAYERNLLSSAFIVDIDTEDDWAVAEDKVRLLRKYNIPFVDPDKTHPHLRGKYGSEERRVEPVDHRETEENPEVQGADVRSTRSLRPRVGGQFGRPPSKEEVPSEGRRPVRGRGLERRSGDVMRQRLKISQSQLLPHPRPLILEQEVAWAYEQITNKIRGVFLLSPSRAGVLRSYTRDSTGAHLDVGTLHGGSAALVGLTSPRKFIYTLDYYNGYYGSGEDGVQDVGRAGWTEPRPDTTWDNFRSICPWRSDYLIVLDVRSDDPTLLPLERFDTAFLDAAAEDPEVIAEFNVIAPRVDKYIIIDDVDARWPDKEWLFWMHSMTMGWEPLVHYIDEDGKGIGVLKRMGSAIPNDLT
ncbi:hypothetical protein LCGC14_2602360, partial [marine sediment metagenome]